MDAFYFLQNNPSAIATLAFSISVFVIILIYAIKGNDGCNGR